jgi:hypothetical protein
MALFEKFKSGKHEELTEAEAAFCIFMSVIYADGKMSDEEINELSYYFSKIKLFKNLTIKDLFPEFQKLFKQFEYNPIKLVEMACPFIASNNHLPIFIYCCDFVYSDDKDKPREELLLQKIMECLTLDEKLAATVIHIMQRKNQL